MSSTKPIGIFDSGIGGLSVLSHIRECMPAEDLIYVSDTRHLPYGTKSPSHVKKRSLLITEFLIEQGVKSVVVACNTATAASITTLRNQFNIPIIGMEPGVKPGIENSSNGKVAILATDGTLGSLKFQELMQRFSGHTTIVIQPCHGWVELVEEQYSDDSDLDSVIREQLHPLMEQGVDTLVLGCTHYPFLRQHIDRIAGGKAHIIDTGEAVAKQLKRRLAAQDLLNLTPHTGTEQFWSSAPSPTTERIVSRLLDKPCVLNQLPE
ncbi:MAG: glutamate racemase [Pseudomonadota bacterium]